MFSPAQKITTNYSDSKKQLVNKQGSKYDTSHKMSHYFLLTGSIHYPPQQGAVQEVNFPEIFQKIRKEYRNLKIKQNTKRQPNKNRT